MTLSFIRKVTLLRMAIDMATMAIAKSSFRGARAIFDKNTLDRGLLEPPITLLAMALKTCHLSLNV